MKEGVECTASIGILGTPLSTLRNLTGIACIFSATLGCNHHVTATTPANPPTPSEKTAMQVDQANTAGWDKAWTNLVNDVEQSFTPSMPRLQAVEVDLVVGNPEPADELTLRVLDGKGNVLALVPQKVLSQDAERVIFTMPENGVELSPGQLYRLRLSGGITFGWKYIVGGYEHGEATFNGHPLLAQARSTFLFRTFGAP